MTAASGKFGSCCDSLKDAMEGGGDFEPLIAEDDGVLYMSVGLVQTEKEEEPNMVDHPVYFCPFCGKGLQTPDEVDAKLGTH